MADGIMGKCGYVYQASSMVYLGSFETQVYMDEITKEKIHPRSCKQLLIQNAKEIGKDHLCWLTEDFCKRHNIAKLVGLMFRYIVPLNKQAIRILDSYECYKNLPYPKDKDLIFKKRVAQGKYVDILQPQFDMKVQNHNYQRNEIRPEPMVLFELLGDNETKGGLRKCQ